MEAIRWSPSVALVDPQQEWRLWTASHTRQVEQASRALESEESLMQRAGSSVARWLIALAPAARRVHVWAGPGGNGGDGLYAAALLRQHGLQVQVTLCQEPPTPGPTSGPWVPAKALELPLKAAQDSGASITQGEAAISRISSNDIRADVVLDALLGIGASRPPAGLMAQAIRAINDQDAPVLSIDLPTGLNGNTGALLAAQAVRATHTLSLLTLKPGLFTGLGRQQAGQVWLDTLGHEALWPTDCPTRLTGWPQAREACRARLHQDHKGTFGDALILGGATGMVGAAQLAAQACLAAGPGRTFLWLLDPASASGLLPRPEILTLPPGWKPGTGFLQNRTVICGCGAGAAVQPALPEVLHTSARLVLDADALNAVAQDRSLGQALRRRASRGLPTVLTPHPLEAARLLDCSTESVQSDRLQAAQTLAQKFCCTVVLKGSGTVTHDGQTAYINPTGGPSLATGGTGDVLAGWLGGLWAQWPASSEASGETSRATRVAAGAAWWHGHAADVLGSRPVRGLELIESLRTTAESAA